MRRALTRVIAVIAFAAAVAAGYMAVTSALDGGSDAKATTFGAARVERSTEGDGRVCFTLSRVGVVLKRTCVAHVETNEIAFAVARRRSGQMVVGGLAGDSVSAVRIGLRPSGQIAAALIDGAFYTPIPRGKTPAAVVKVLDDGTSASFAVARSAG